VIVLFALAHFTEKRREDAAFRRTEALAQQHADTVLKQSAVLLNDRRALEAELEASHRGGVSMATLYTLVARESTVTEVVQFSEAYERELVLLGPATDMARRCYTIVYKAAGTQSATAEVTAHDSHDSCARIAEKFEDAHL
jgi:hypothetical protein